MWLTIPNLFTLARIAAAPFILLRLARGEYAVAGWMFGFAALTDILDGALARRFGSQSKTGRFLDPTADKLLLSSIYIGLAIAHAIPVWVVVVVFTRDLWIVLLSGAALAFTNFRQLQPSIWGKASTFVQIMAAVCVFGVHAYGSALFAELASPLVWGVVLLAVISGADYTLRGVRYIRTGRGSISVRNSGGGAVVGAQR